MFFEQLPIFGETNRFVNELIKLHEKLPKSVKYTLGDKLLNDSLELFNYIQLANSTKWKDGKKEYIEKFILKFNLVKVVLRLLVDNRYITFKQHSILLPYIESIGKQATGWKKSKKSTDE